MTAPVTRNCPHGHPVDLSRVSPGRQTDCRACKAPGACDQCPPGGKRVPVRRLTTAPAAADRADPWGPSPLPSWDGKHHPGPPVGDCPACDDDDARPTPRATLLWCPSARRYVLPPAVAAKMAAAADRATVAKRPAAEVADPAAELRAALALDAERARSAAIYRAWAEALDPDGLADNLAEACVTLCAAFVGADGRGGLARAAERAETPDALATVRQVAAEVIAQARQIEDTVTGERERLAAADDAEADDYPEPDDGQDDDGPDDPLWTAARGLHPPRVVMLPAPARNGGPPLPAGLSPAARAVAQTVEGRGQWSANTGARADMGPCPQCGAPWRGCLHQRGTVATRQAPPGTLELFTAKLAQDRARIKQYGPCARGRHGLFGATPAPTRRVVGNNTGVPGYTTHGAPALYICASAKCLSWADAEFRRIGYRDCTYTELP